MAKIQHSLFTWQAVESSNDIFRFGRMLEGLDDDRLIRALEGSRRGRRDDHPVRAMWNSVLAGLVFGHDSTASLRRELRRNAELRQVCGFDVTLGDGAVGDKDVYYRFLNKLDAHSNLVMEVFERCVEQLGKLLKNFGGNLAADAKAIVACRSDDCGASLGRKRAGHPDGDDDAQVSYEWFGYKLHLICDANYGLPVAFKVTGAHEHESPHLMGLVEHGKQRHEEIIKCARTLAADRGFDDGADKTALYEKYAIKHIMPPRDLTQGRYDPLDDQKHDTIYLSSTGQVCCKTHPFAADDNQCFTPMHYMGFEAKRNALKFRCPAAVRGLPCENRDACRCSPHVKNGAYGRVVRVPLSREPRLLGPLYPHSKTFEKIYRGRTEIERFFYRLDHMYGFEKHNTRGLSRMTTRIAMALIAMSATAIGWIQAGQPQNARRRFQAA